MALLDWLEEDEDDLPAPAVYLVPIYKKQWGTFYIQADNEEDARIKFLNSLSLDVEANTEWEGDPEYEYESCGMIERED